MLQSIEHFRGQGKAIALLDSAMAKGKLGGTVLMLGQRGLGKTTLALCIARAVACEKNRLASRLWFCGECYACRSIAASQQPELVIIRPLGQDIKVEQFEGSKSRSSKDDAEGKREYSVFHAALIKPALLSHRVFIIDEAHHLNEETSNKLLKILEEAPSHTIFILVTDQPQKLLPTVRSRGRQFVLSPVPPNELEKVVRHEYSELDISTARDVADMAVGSYVSAIQLAGSERWRTEIKSLAKNLQTKSTVIGGAEALVELEFQQLWEKEMRDLGDGNDESGIKVAAARKNELKRQAISTAYERALHFAIKRGGIDPGLARRIIQMKAYINQNVDPELAQATLS